MSQFDTAPEETKTEPSPQGVPAAPIEGAQKGVEQTLPELELREIQKSAQPIDMEGDIKREIETIRAWNNYTIVTLQDSTRIKILDESAEIIEDFNAPLSDKQTTVRWASPSVRDKIQQGNELIKEIGQDDRSYGDERHISDLPFELQIFARAALRHHRNLNFSHMASEFFSTSNPQFPNESQHSVIECCHEKSH